MIESWLIAIRDHPDRPPAMQRHILTMLALRMNWTTGQGFAGIRDLMADADASKATVCRATRWARDSQLLLCTRRGHYVSAQTAIASEWQLTRPVDNPGQGLTREPLGQSQGLNGSNPRSQWRPPKVSVETTHQESSSSKSSTSSGPRTEACKSGDHRLCMFTWCACACGHRLNGKTRQ